MQDKISIIPSYLPPGKRTLFSDLDNIETFVQFSDVRKGMKDQKSSFLQVNYRIKNLELVRKLKECKFKDHETIKKVSKGLHCCSTISTLEITTKNSASIQQSSKKCRRSCCPRCNQIRSGTYRNRFYKCLVSDENKHLFKKKYFYFLTLTLKHNTHGTRSEVYLVQLKTYVKRLKRSNLWKKHFPYSKSNPSTGIAESYEMTITPNGYHIHAHIMLCTYPIKIKALTLEKQLRNKWKKITTDSTGVRFDMVKVDQNTIDKIKKGQPSSKFNGLIMEVFKYTVKLGDIHKLNSHDTDLFANWLIKTKGKNMIIAGGFFRGLQLFGLKSKWDDKTEKPKIEKSGDFKYMVGRTSQINFNVSTRKHYSKEEREQILSDIYLTAVPTSFLDITKTGDYFDRYMNMSINPEENRWGTSDLDRIKTWIMVAELEEAERKFYEDLDQPLDQDFIDQANIMYFNPEYEQLEFQY